LPLKTLLEAIEPLPGYARHHQGVAYSTDLPLTRLADMAQPDPKLPRLFRQTLDQVLATPDEFRMTILRGWLEQWRDNHIRFVELAKDVPALKGAETLSLQLNQAAVMGLELLAMVEEGRSRPEKQAAFEGILKQVSTPGMECRIAWLPSLELLMKKVFGK